MAAVVVATYSVVSATDFALYSAGPSARLATPASFFFIADFFSKEFVPPVVDDTPPPPPPVPAIEPNPPSEFVLERALAIRENVLQLQFSAAPYFSGLLDPGDASDRKMYQVTTVAGTVGLDEVDVHPVSVVAVSRTLLANLPGNVPYGRWIELTFDRPMSPYPAQYQIALSPAMFTLEELV